MKMITVEGKRHYVTPEGNEYPSVTTFLRPHTDQTHIKRWRQRVGKTTADAVTISAANRGKSIHKLCEDFVLNKPESETTPINRYAFAQAKPLLTKHITKVHNAETKVYSDSLKLAGTLDLLGEWDNVPAIIDFKTSKTVKKREWIDHHFLQATAYTIMVYERVKLLPKRIVLVFIPMDDEPQFYVENPRRYLQQLIDLTQLNRAAA